MPQYTVGICFLFPLLQAKEAQEDLVKTKEELHLVMTTPPPPPPPVYEPVNYHVHDNLQDEGIESSGYSAEFSSEGILNDRNEEKRITEAEKNERVQRQLKVCALSNSHAVRVVMGRWPYSCTELSMFFRYSEICPD